MKNLKKFFAFSIATAMVAGAVWAGTPAFQALADETNTYWWDEDNKKYVELNDDHDKKGYVQVYYDEQKGKYVQVGKSDEPSPDTPVTPGTVTPGDSSSGTPVKISHILIQAKTQGLYINETSQLSIKAYPEGAKTPEITWISSDPSVVSVDQNGVITGKSSGTATITATPKDYNELSRDIFIYVTKPGIEVTPTEQTIYVGSYAYVRATVEYNSSKRLSDITWSIDNPDKVFRFGTYSDNFLPIEALKPGDVKITASINDGDNKWEATSIIHISAEASKQNATDPNAPTSEEQAKQEQTPESIANYQTWLATYGGGTTAAAGTTAVSGTVGQPGSEVIVDTGAGEPVTMFQSNDATNTLLAAPVGVVPSGTKIETVEAGKDTPAFKAVQNKLSRISRRGTVQKVYGIAGLNPDGSLMTLINGKAAMSMPMPTDITVPAGKSLKVYLIDDNGQTTKLDTAIDQGRVVFEIPKFGTFAFVVE